MGDLTDRRAIGVSSGVAERLAVLVHEVRSPVAALAAIAEAYTEAGEDGVARQELARLAVAACRGVERIVADATVASVRLEPLAVADLVRQAAAAAALRGAHVETSVADGLPLVQGDPQRLRQALDNLLVNALTHAGSEEAVLVSAGATADTLLLSVADSGIGIPPDEQDRIFESGARLDESRAGSGLGLAIARAIAEAHGGTLTVLSTQGQGATFTIAIPLA
jgi:signal transduction histidine kinase